MARRHRLEYQQQTADFRQFTSREESFEPVLRSSLDALGLTPDQFGESIGVSGQAVRTWLLGQASLSWRTLRVIVDVYGVAPEKLLPVRKAA